MLYCSSSFGFDRKRIFVLSNTVHTGYRKQDRSFSENVRLKKKRKRRKPLNLKKTGVVAAAAVVAAVSAYAIYSHLPFVKVGRAIAAGDRYTEESDYEAAIDSYSKAIRIDSNSVTAYSNMAGAYLSIDDSESAKKILYDGWRNTENTDLLNSYHTVILNEAVDEMNAGKSDMNTVMSIVSVLEEDNENADAVALLDSAYERVFNNSYSYSADALFRSDASTYSSEGGSATYSYNEYEAFLNKLLDIFSATGNQKLGDTIVRFATPNLSSFTMSLDDTQSYLKILEKIESAGLSGDNLSTMMDCLKNSEEVLGIFSGIFEQLDVGNVDELRDFVVSDSYLGLRDVFLNDEETPQENTVYVPISREAIVLNNSEGKWTYRFLDFDENPTTKGVITLWANYFEDDGVQRNSISYEPASLEDNYYPHTKYSVTYLYSYITQGRSTRVAKMNYRLDTTITTRDGEEIETIVGDWGGPNEWTMDIDTIESRIKA